MTEMICLAVQCVERLSSQSVTAVSLMLAHDIMASLTAQLHTHDAEEYITVKFKGEDAQAESGIRQVRDKGTPSSRGSSSVGTRLQRQCIATLSSLALSASGPSLNPSGRLAVERGLLFLACFHWESTVRGEANLALRRLQSRLALPHPRWWSETDCLTWLGCINLGGLHQSLQKFLYASALQRAHPPERLAGQAFIAQCGKSGVSGSRFSTGQVWCKKGLRQHGYIRDEHQTLYSSKEANFSRTLDGSTDSGVWSIEGGRNCAPDGAELREGASWGRRVNKPGIQLLQARKNLHDLLSYPIEASPEEATSFLRNLRNLRLMADVSSFQLDGEEGEVDNITKAESGGERDGDGVVGLGGGKGGGSTWGTLLEQHGFSLWQEKKHTINEISRILKQTTAATAGFFPTETSRTSYIASWDTVEAADQFGTVRTFRLIRPNPNSTSDGPNAFHRISNPSNAQARQFLKPGSCQMQGIEDLPSPHERQQQGYEQIYGMVPKSMRTPMGKGENILLEKGGGVCAGLQSTGNRAYHGLRFLGLLVDEKGKSIVEVYEGSLHQQALQREAHRVLSQPQNVGRSLELVDGVATVSVQHNSVEALCKASRPFKKVTIEFSASLTMRESPDPEGYMSTTLEVLEDTAGISHLYVLDMCHVTDKQDPRDGSTSLIRAVLDNKPELVKNLLAKGVNISIADDHQRTALLYSVIKKYDDITQMILRHHSALVRKSINSNAQGGNRLDPWLVLHHHWSGKSVSSIFSENERSGRATSSVIDEQAMLDQRDYKGTAALHHAVADMEERKDIVQSLLQAKAQVNIRDANKNSPLHLACQYGHVDIVKSLIRYSANTGARNVMLMTPLHIASQCLHIKIVGILLKENQGSMVTAEDSRGWTALHYACRSHSNTGVTARDVDLDLIKEEEEEVVQLLLRHGASLHNLDKNANKPLDFGKYFDENQAEIMQAVHDSLDFRIQHAIELFRTVTSVPRRLILWLRGKGGTWYAHPIQVLHRLEYHRGKQRFQAAGCTFSSARVQEAVHEEWIIGGHRRRTMHMLLLYILYLTSFTLSAVYNSGQNRTSSYQLTR
ncbi:unnamed protein product [Choristocarpus tenellus]